MNPRPISNASKSVYFVTKRFSPRVRGMILEYHLDSEEPRTIKIYSRYYPYLPAGKLMANVPAMLNVNFEAREVACKQYDLLSKLVFKAHPRKFYFRSTTDTPELDYRVNADTHSYRCTWEDNRLPRSQVQSPGMRGKIQLL